MPTLFRVAALGLVLTLLGCGGGGHKTPDLTEAVVVVTLNGQPLPNAEVTFTPSTAGYGPDAISTGVTDDAGRAKLTTGGKPGACVGPNKVTVIDAPPPEDTRSEDQQAQVRASQYMRSLKNRPIPPKYATLAQSDLTVEVKKGQAEYPIELKR